MESAVEGQYLVVGAMFPHGALHHLHRRYDEFNNQIQLRRREKIEQRSRLSDGAREAVEEESALDDVASGESGLDEVGHHPIGEGAPSSEMLASIHAEGRLGCHSLAKQVID
jgi:hypothetical protein